MAKTLKIKPNRLLILALAVLLIIGLAVGLVSLLFGSRGAALQLAPTSLARGQDFRIDGEGIAFATDEAFFEYRAGGGGNPLTTTPLGAPISGYDMSGDNLAVFSGSTLQIRGLAEVELTGTIHAVRCGNNHVAVLRRNAQSGADSIIVFDSAGAASADALDYSDGKVLNFGFHTEGGNELLWAVTVATAQSRPVFVVKMHDYAGGGAMRYLPSFFDQAIERIFFTEDSIFVAGTQDLVRYTLTGGREKYRVRIFGQSVLDMGTSSGGVSFLLQPRGENFLRTLRVLTVAESDYAGESLVSLHLPDAPVSAFLQNGSLYAFTSERLYGFNYAGRSILDLELPATPLRVRAVGQAHMLFETEDRVYLATVTS